MACSLGHFSGASGDRDGPRSRIGVLRHHARTGTQEGNNPISLETASAIQNVHVVVAEPATAQQKRLQHSKSVSDAAYRCRAFTALPLATASKKIRTFRQVGENRSRSSNNFDDANISVINYTPVTLSPNHAE